VYQLERRSEQQKNLLRMEHYPVQKLHSSDEMETINFEIPIFIVVYKVLFRESEKSNLEANKLGAPFPTLPQLAHFHESNQQEKRIYS
jgi:hypothetical protein